MKIKINHINELILLGSIVLMLGTACNKNEFSVDNSFARAFHPTTLATKSNSVTATSVTLEWPIVPGVKTYILELSRDSLLFENIVETYQISADTIPSTADAIGITLHNLFGNTNYSARVKTTSASGLPDSKYISITFKTKSEQILSSVGSTDKTATTVTVRWPSGFSVTHFMVTPAGGTGQKSDISADEKVAGAKTFTGLTAATSYTFDIYNTDLNKRGSVSVVTFSNPPSAGRVVWLTAADTLGIQNVLDSCTASSLTIVLPNGKYVFRSATDVALNIKAGLQSVNFYAIPGSDTTKLKVKVFSLPTPLSMDAITFENLIVGGYDAGADYCYNPSTITGTLANISYKNCQIRDFRGVVRLKGSITISNFSLTNCIVSNIKGYGLVTMDSNNAPLVDNITLDGCTFKSMDVFIQSAYRNISSLNISNCTFYDMVNVGKYFIDFKTTFAPAAFNITNCIFSNIRYTTNATTGVITYAGGYQALSAPMITNCYSTSDFIITRGAFAGLISYAKSSTDLFTDPTHGNFKIMDQSFVGISSAGDPRWRQ